MTTLGDVINIDFRFLKSTNYHYGHEVSFTPPSIGTLGVVQPMMFCYVYVNSWSQNVYWQDQYLCIFNTENCTIYPFNMPIVGHYFYYCSKIIWVCKTSIVCFSILKTQLFYPIIKSILIIRSAIFNSFLVLNYGYFGKFQSHFFLTTQV